LGVNDLPENINDERSDDCGHDDGPQAQRYADYSSLVHRHPDSNGSQLELQAPLVGHYDYDQRKPYDSNKPQEQGTPQRITHLRIPTHAQLEVSIGDAGYTSR